MARGLLKRGKKFTSKNRKLFGVGKLINLGKKFRKLIKHNPSIPRLAPRRSLAAVPRDKDYNPCANAQMCLNEAKCVNRNGNFDCICKPGFTGKRCENTVSLQNCRDNKCQYGSNCYSVAESFYVVDVVAFRQAKEQNPGRTIHSNDFLIEISYRCDCLEGYSGDLCELSPNDLYCMTDYCLNNGLGEWNSKDNRCLCECDDGFEGDQCEIVQPCFAYDCNFGRCTEVERQDVNGTIEKEAFCECGSTLPFTEISITGDNCSSLEIPDASLQSQDKIGVIPCTNGSLPGSAESFDHWVANIKNHQAAMKLTQSDVDFLEKMKTTCRVPDKNSQTGGDPDLVPAAWKSCSHVLDASKNFCLKDSACEPFVMKVPSGTEILAPRCICSDMQEGNFCEYKREDACDPTLEEFEKGITRHKRCTSLTNGVCSGTIRKNEAVCICNPGYTGALCEKFDPCAGMFCPQNSQCVPLDPDRNRADAMSLRLFQCVCNDGYVNVSPTAIECQPGVGSGKCIDKGLCHHGTCVDCGKKAPEGNLQMCNDHELVLKYKCLCEPGWAGYHCEHELSICSNNQCKNGAICHQTENIDYECICRPGTRGSFCEFVDDYCMAFGDDKCVNGHCVESDQWSRQFRCECVYGFAGRDCELQISKIDLILQFWERYEPWCLGCSSASLMLILLVCHRFTFLWEPKKKPKPEQLTKSEHQSEETTTKTVEKEDK